MSTKTRDQLLAEIEAVIRPGTANSAKITAQDMRTAFTTIIDELLARTAGPDSNSALEFVFAAGFDNEISAVIGSSQAGSYRLAITQNTTAVSFAINGNAAAEPLTLQTGDELAVTVTRMDADRGAIARLESVSEVL